MKLSINYSPQAAALYQAGSIYIDSFKCPDWPYLIEEARQYRPVTVHFDLDVGDSRLLHKDWEPVERLLQETGTPFVNLHLGPEAKDFPGYPVDTPEPNQQQQVTKRMLADVQAVVRKFGPRRVIVENVPYRANKKGRVLRPGVEPQVIRKIVAETGCGLLLDISHARIAANALGMDEKEYMENLPVDSLRELHFTGLHTIDGVLRDHLEILEEDWPVLSWVLENIRQGKWAVPWMLAFEYGGIGEKFDWRSKTEVIAEQVPRLYEMVAKI